MTRLWTGFIDVVAQVMSLPLAVLLLFVAAGIIGLLWYFFPRWVPRRLPRFGKPGWKLRLRWPQWRWPNWRAWFRRKRKTPSEPGAADEAATEEESADALPDLPVEAFISLADRYAAEGRYAEAIRERLRAIVRDLVDRGVIEHRPGWTVTELAGAASLVRPPVREPLGGATDMFSEIWYGQLPATAEHDHRMRQLVTQVSETGR